MTLPVDITKYIHELGVVISNDVYLLASPALF